GPGAGGGGRRSPPRGVPAARRERRAAVERLAAQQVDPRQAVGEEGADLVGEAAAVLAADLVRRARHREHGQGGHRAAGSKEKIGSLLPPWKRFSFSPSDIFEPNPLKRPSNI